MKITFNIRTKEWYRRPSVRIMIRDINSIDEIDEVIQAMHAMKHESALIKHFQTNSHENL